MVIAGGGVAVPVDIEEVPAVGIHRGMEHPATRALTVQNFGVGWVLSALATMMPVELPFRLHVWRASVDRLSM